MSDLRVQRFTNPDEVQWASCDGEPPDTGWAFVGPGDVYHDRVQVGHLACLRMGHLDDSTAYCEIEYRAVEHSQPTGRFSASLPVEHHDPPGLCQDCGATHVQHRSLLRVIDGRRELLLLCSDCHLARHAL